MILTTTLGHGWHLTCPDCRAVLTPPRGASLPHPDYLRALACPLCEDARDLAMTPPKLSSTVGENSSCLTPTVGVYLLVWTATDADTNHERDAMSRDIFTNNTFTTYTDARNHITTSGLDFDDAECERIGRILWDLTQALGDGEEVEADEMWREVLTQAGLDPSDFGY